MAEGRLLLDLFCGAGGAAAGYHRAGFEIVGVDIEPQPNYPYEFHRADAMEVAYGLMVNVLDLPYAVDEFAAVHASPPCQGYSALRGFTDGTYPLLIEPVRERLRLSGLPYVIENVVGAPLENPIQLCGSSFGLGVRRHRLFECSFPLFAYPCQHVLQPHPIDVTGTGGPSSKPRLDKRGGRSRKPRNLAEAREAMGIDWMTREELSEAIPPAYTQHIGDYLMAHLNQMRSAA